MSFDFRKINARDTLFIKVRETHKNDYDHFKNYADELTQRMGNSIDNKSGKSHSYANYLIRLVILYQELFAEEINNLLTFTTLKKIEQVINHADFKEYNNSEKRFPNAAFNCYVACVTNLNAEKEEMADVLLNNSLENVSDDESNRTIDGQQKRKEKSESGGFSTYPRDKGESLHAKKRSNWQCDLNPQHITFTSKSNGKPYTEAHHLIPMSAQDYFENTIDFSDNIVSLCPNCHRKVHYADDEEKKEALEILYNMRKRKYPKYGVDINFKKILNFYEIF